MNAETIAGTLAFCSLPTVNPTVPTAVTSLGLVLRPGVIEANWDEPVVWPRNAYFRLMEASVNSYGASAAVWQGDAQRAVITKPNTASYFYWLDAVAVIGSYNTFPGVSSGMPGNALLVERANVNPGDVTNITVASRSSDTFTAGLWASSADPESLGVVATGQVGQSIEVTVTAQVEVSVFAAVQDLDCKFFWHSSLNKVSGSQDNYYPITRAGKFTVTVSATFSSASGIDGSVGAINNVFNAPASVGNTIIVTDHHIRVTSVRR